VVFWLHRWDCQKDVVQAGEDAVDDRLAVPVRKIQYLGLIHQGTMPSAY
jgi:hypothetical protein